MSKQLKLIDTEKEIVKKNDKNKLTTAELDQVRRLEGFPLGRDEDIINLSDPPYYTACPNPYLQDFIDRYGKPFDAAIMIITGNLYVDVLGKMTPFIRPFLSYQGLTAIMRYIPTIQSRAPV